MATILVRHLDGEAVRRLEERAAGNGRTLESEARHILEQAAGDDMEEKRRAFRELSKKMRELTSDRSRYTLPFRQSQLAQSVPVAPCRVSA